MNSETQDVTWKQLGAVGGAVLAIVSITLAAHSQVFLPLAVKECETLIEARLGRHEEWSNVELRRLVDRLMAIEGEVGAARAQLAILVKQLERR